MLGPEANHFITVAHPENFHWRESSFGDLIPLLGDGLLTIDDDYHDRARAIMMPAFHRAPADRLGRRRWRPRPEAAIAALRPGEVVDLYDWMRNLAMRIAMRALLGLDPDEAGKGAAAAEHFERALGFYGIDYPLRLLRGPGSPWRKLIASRQVLDEIVFGEIERRRAEPDERAPGHPQPPARRPRRGGRGVHRPRGARPGDDADVRRPRHLDLDPELHDARAGPPPRRGRRGYARSRTGCSAASRRRSTRWRRRCPTSRWSSTRCCASTRRPGSARGAPCAISSSAATRVPRGAYVNYCSWASHRIPEVFPDPEAFIPERFTRERKAALPRGAYVPFGAGQRICIGKRFGQTEVKLVATMLLQRLRLDALPGRTMTVRQMPTLSPKGGLKMRILSRA